MPLRVYVLEILEAQIDPTTARWAYVLQLTQSIGSELSFVGKVHRHSVHLYKPLPVLTRYAEEVWGAVGVYI